MTSRFSPGFIREIVASKPGLIFVFPISNSKGSGVSPQ